ncbi:hypothetical protein [Kitasatospora sp. NPDC088779]|uniref:hypothetical protein n=1 Tax=Kitasatospora sp. NPDC088779 TaxID=3154964 RepID=UPI0034390874
MRQTAETSGLVPATRRYHMIKRHQVYRDCDPRSSVTIRILRYTPGDVRALVVDAITGKRQRQILASRLHASAVTATGQPRRSGYVLVQDAGEP